jgi:HD superfamily phosphohydrolase
MLFHQKQINDPVHGLIGLSKLEADIISSRSFQRLHNVKQLGLASLIFPSANYSRFSHSVGACHIAGRLMESIARNSGSKIDDQEVQAVRLAGLLHDIGHYPFSHTTEHAVRDFYANSLLTDGDEFGAENAGSAYGHEALGRKIFDLDDELNEIFEAHEFDAARMKAIFSKEVPSKYVGLVSSDLDCDRLDYLSRTAHHAGLPYGRVDTNYIINQAIIDHNDEYCLTRKALRAADHMLVSRYFDYTQVPYHKTVVGLEMLLEEVLRSLLEQKIIDFSAANLERLIKENRWSEIDDQWMIEKFREALTSADADPALALNIESILYRHPPSVIVGYEQITSREYKPHFLSACQQIEEKIDKWAEEFSVERYRWHFWKTDLKMTSMGSKISPFAGELDEYEKTQIVKIQGADAREPNKNKPIFECERALTKTLLDFQFYAMRLYINGHGVENFEKTRSEIRLKIFADLPHFQFV